MKDKSNFLWHGMTNLLSSYRKLQEVMSLPAAPPYLPIFRVFNAHTFHVNNIITSWPHQLQFAIMQFQKLYKIYVMIIFLTSRKRSQRTIFLLSFYAQDYEKRQHVQNDLLLIKRFLQLKSKCYLIILHVWIKSTYHLLL